MKSLARVIRKLSILCGGGFVQKEEVRRQYDPRPVADESLCEFIDRTICHCPASRLWFVWGWPDPHEFYFFEVSRPLTRKQKAPAKSLWRWQGSNTVQTSKVAYSDLQCIV